MVAIDGNTRSLEFRYKGVYDHELLYKSIANWMIGHGYVFVEKMHKFKPPELELEFEGKRKDTGYKMTNCSMKFHAWYWKVVKIKKGDKEKEMINARFRIDLKFNNTYDYKNRFKKGTFLAKMQSFLHNFVLFYKINIFDDDKIYAEINQLMENIRTWTKTTTGEGTY